MRQDHCFRMGASVPKTDEGVVYTYGHCPVSDVLGIDKKPLPQVKCEAIGGGGSLTTLDSATRLGKYAVQEFAESRASIFTNNHVATIVVVVGAGALALSGTWSAVWPLFGSANQMLGAIALLGVL